MDKYNAPLTIWDLHDIKGNGRNENGNNQQKIERKGFFFFSIDD